MNTEQEKMEALKRAYAEMILNTTKEAAARVMAAELRAGRLEQQLAFTTDEATRMLTRLKQSLDEKIKEGKSTTMDQQRKINELECQLNEAEGIVIDLRAELNHVQKQLAEEKKKKQLPTVGCNEYEKFHNVAANGNNSSYALSFTPALDAIPELITSNGRLLSSDVGLVDHCNDRVIECSKLNTDDDDHYSGERCPVYNEMEEPRASILQEDANSGKDCTISVIRKSQRKRKLKVWDDVITTFGLGRSGQFKKPRQTFSSLTCCTTSRLKQSSESDDEGQPRAKAEVETEESVDNLPEKEDSINDKLVKQEEVAATTELSSLEAEGEAGGIGAITASKFNHARRKLFKYAFGQKWKSLSTIYPGSCEESGHSDLENS